MDEGDGIPRREALTGLGFLAMLMLALVGTIVARIVRSAPEVVHGPAPPPPTWASQDLPAHVDDEVQQAGDPPAAEDPSSNALAVDQLPIATPIPTVATDAASIPAGSEAPALTPPDEMPPQEPIARPVFVAPAGR
jgi:hypothetical protein